MTDRDQYHSLILVGQQMQDTWDPWRQLDLLHLYNRDSTGKKAWHRAFKPDKLSDCRIVVVVSVRGKMRLCLWQLGCLHL